MPATSTKTSATSATKTANAKTAAKKAVDMDVKEDIVDMPLNGDDDVAVVSFVPYRVSYDDKATFDKYVWEGVGEVQYMTLDALTRMRRNHPDYFNNMELKPEDERVIKKLNLSGIYDKYEHLMTAESYTRDCIGEIVNEISALRNGAKITVVHKIKGMVESGEITDINVIRTIEKRLGIDLIAIL